MKILLIHGDSIVRAFFKYKITESLKGSVDDVSSIKKAMQLLKMNRPYDAIVSDVLSMDGKAMELLRFKMKHKMDTPLVYLSTGCKIQIPFPINQYKLIDGIFYQELCSELREIIHHRQ